MKAKVPFYIILATFGEIDLVKDNKFNLNLPPRRIEIFAGGSGSGKTEISINRAIQLRRNGTEVALVDLDIVKPYFRSREKRVQLEEEGIALISSLERLIHSDLPALSPRIMGVLQNRDYTVIIDVGGDDEGAVALGRFKPYLPDGSYEMYMVINTRRPFSRDVRDIIRTMQKISSASRLKITGLVGNTNLGNETNWLHIKEGYRTLEDVAYETGLPIRFISLKEDLIEDSEDYDIPLFPLKLFIKPPWEID